MTTDILVILDRSGSMQSRRSDHEGGLKSFVESQAAFPGDVRFTLVQFDSVAPCEIVYDRVPIAEATDIRLVPRGDTPLLDAMGKALAHLEAHKPESVICMVITDGEENSSREWTKAQVAARVKELSADHRWQFLFLAANVVCVTLKPTDKDKFDNGASPSVIVQPTAIFAKDETTAALRAGGLVSAITPTPDPNRVEVQVIPFRACAR